jgi:hypothetical protein
MLENLLGGTARMKVIISKSYSITSMEYTTQMSGNQQTAPRSTQVIQMQLGLSLSLAKSCVSLGCHNIPM